MRTKTYLPLFSGFYGSYWDEPDFYGEEEYFNLPEGMEFYDFVDWHKYHDKIAREMTSKVEDLLSDFVDGIAFEELVSPKYYNYSNDSINCEIEFEPIKILRYLVENRKEFDKYIKDRYTSRDGFISFLPNNTIDWIKDWRDDSHKVGSILQFICENEGFEEPWDLDDCHVSLFYKEEIYEYENN